MFDLFERLEQLTPAALTVRAQTRLANGVPGEQLVWDRFFPRTPATSIKLSELVVGESRPTADRRPWDAPGRLITLILPEFRTYEMTPIEAYFTLGERDIQLLSERHGGNVDLALNALGADLPGQTNTLGDAAYRRIELDAHDVWQTGRIYVRNPQTGESEVSPLGIAAERYTTPVAPWTDENAYEKLLEWIQAGIPLTGPISGVCLRYRTALAIKRSAPKGTAGVELTMKSLLERLSDELGTAFNFRVDEQTLDVYEDAGTRLKTVNRWRPGKIAAIPASGRIGSTHFAPVLRAQQIAAQIPNNAVDVRGVTVFQEKINEGKGLKVSAQLNGLPIPDERAVWVVDAGI